MVAELTETLTMRPCPAASIRGVISRLRLRAVPVTNLGSEVSSGRPISVKKACQ
jgi:hypothetical protein